MSAAERSLATPSHGRCQKGDSRPTDNRHRSHLNRLNWNAATCAPLWENVPTQCMAITQGRREEREKGWAGVAPHLRCASGGNWSENGETGQETVLLRSQLDPHLASYRAPFATTQERARTSRTN